MRIKRVPGIVLLSVLVGTVAGIIVFGVGRDIISCGNAAVTRHGSIWYETDADRYLQNMTDQSSRHSRTSVHPLYPLFAYSSTKIVSVLLARNDNKDFVPPMIVVAAWTACVGGFLLLILYKSTNSMAVAVLASAVYLASGSTILLNTLPESHQLGQLALCLAMLIVLHGVRGALSHVIVSAFSLSTTVTNWVYGVLSTFLVRRSAREWIRVTVYAFALVSLLNGLQGYYFSRVKYFIGDSNEGQYLEKLSVQRIGEVTLAMMLHPVVTPMPYVTTGQYPKILNHRQGISYPSLAGTIGAVLYGILLIVGAASIMRIDVKLVSFMLLGMCAMWIVHLFYGYQTFMYSPNWMPVLIVVIANGARRLRTIGTLLLIGLLICVAANTMEVLTQSLNLLKSHY